MVVQDASPCRRISAEGDSRLKSQTVSRIDARKTSFNGKSLRRCWFGQRVKGGGNYGEQSLLYDVRFDVQDSADDCACLHNIVSNG